MQQTKLESIQRDSKPLNGATAETIGKNDLFFRMGK
jgi:hypothetical protein